MDSIVPVVVPHDQHRVEQNVTNDANSGGVVDSNSNEPNTSESPLNVNDGEDTNKRNVESNRRGRDVHHWAVPPDEDPTWFGAGGDDQPLSRRQFSF